MCSIGAAIGVSAASSIFGFASQSSQASAQASYQSKMSRQQAKYQGMVFDLQSDWQQRMLDWQVRDFQQQLDYRDELMAFQEGMYLQTYENAVDDVNRGYTQIKRQLDEAEVMGNEEIAAITRQSEALQGQQESQFADQGVAGPTADYVINAFAVNELRANENIRLEREWANRQGNMDMMSLEARAQARIDAATPQPVPLPTIPQPLQPIAPAQPYQGQMINRPNPFASLLGAAGNILGIYGTWGAETGVPGEGRAQRVGGVPFGGTQNPYSWRNPRPYTPVNTDFSGTPF